MDLLIVIAIVIGNIVLWFVGIGFICSAIAEAGERVARAIRGEPEPAESPSPVVGPGEWPRGIIGPDPSDMSPDDAES